MGYSFKEFFTKEPQVISSGLLAVLNAVVLFGWNLSAEQLAGTNVAVVAVLGWFYVRPATVTKATLNETAVGASALAGIEAEARN